ncbi:MAG TPA: multicopper oxidase domain-containing protein, partial [Verrucomicrobiae bacterium]|nr:multicopper oxidase domain-containing protein [Verrucomicrobiae bacterium]
MSHKAGCRIIFNRSIREEYEEMNRPDFTLTRRDLLRLSILTGGATLIGSRAAWALQDTCGQSSIEDIEQAVTTCGAGLEAMPISPLLLEPFTEDLPIPKALRPGWRRPDGNLDPYTPDAWTCRTSYSGSNNIVYPGPEDGHQDAMGHRPNGAGLPWAGTHQLWPGIDPIYYHIRLQVAEHRVTDKKVRPIGKISKGKGKVIIGPTGADTQLPDSTIYGFNGTFPGPLINAEYGRPVCVRFENDLDKNPDCLDRQDFGAPDWAFLTHLHNGHTAPESDGQPHHLMDNGGGYLPGQWSDNLYLMYPAGNDDREKQSFLWFHDHRMHHTGANVYKGMVGLMPHYDPGVDDGDERHGLRLPGVRINNSDGTFDVKYDIPLALYDCALDDGVTPHADSHTPLADCGKTHPEWWGKLFFRHYPNHGFVGDIFTVNGKAFPVLRVKRRKYRLRFLGASIARIYELSLMQGNIGAVPGQQGQYNFGATDRKGNFIRSRGQQCMRLTQIASEGGLLPSPIVRDSFQIWPAKRREFIVDFTKYMDNSPTHDGDVIYLANTMFMPDGRKPEFPGEKAFDANYCVPMLKIIIDGNTPESDDSVMPTTGGLRAMPDRNDPVAQRPTFTLERGGPTEESQWVINGLEFDPQVALHTVKRGTAEEWTIVNGGGGWVHPMHMHQ